MKLNNAPQGYPGPNPCIVNVGPMRFVAGVYLEILNWGDYPGLSRHNLVQPQKLPLESEVEGNSDDRQMEGCSQLALKREPRAGCSRTQWWQKDQKAILCQSLLGDHPCSPDHVPDFSQEKLIQKCWLLQQWEVNWSSYRATKFLLIVWSSRKNLM